MPHVVNGCGTWYYGKKNLHSYTGTCRACGAFATLTSYDTRLYGVFFMIPILPLARKHIVEECSACRQHFAVPLKQWQLAQKRTIDMTAAYRSKPTDPEAAKEAIGACASNRDLNTFLEIAPEIEKNLAGDHKTLILLTAANDIFGRPCDAERVCRAALQLKDEDEVREVLADILMRQGRPEDAAPYLQHIIDKQIPDRIDPIYMLAQNYQLKGEHEKALAAFDQCLALAPKIAEDTTFMALREASQQRAGTKKAVKPGEVVSSVKRRAAWRKFARVAPIAIALALLAYGALSWFQGTRRGVYLVNGLGKPYTVRINDVAHELRPLAPTLVHVAEGDVKVEIADAATSAPASEVVSIRTPFLTRPFAGRTFVINPDGAVVLQRSRVFYGSKSSHVPEPQVSYAAGQVLHRFDGIDHEFERPPESISVKSGSSGGERDVLTVMGASEGTDAVRPEFLLLAMANDLGDETVVRIAQRRMLLEPERGEFLAVLNEKMKPQELADFLRPHLAARPLYMQIHRTYQTAMGNVQQDEQVAREYAEMLAREPQDKNLMYLAGRVTSDLDEQVKLFKRAADGEKPCAYAFFALSSHCMANGEFHDAAEHAQKAAAMMPEQREASWYCRRALLADRQFERVVQLAANEEGQPFPYAVTAFGDEVYACTLLGRSSDAEKAIAQLQGRLKPFGDKEAQESVNNLRADVAYASGNPNNAADILARSSDPADRLTAHLMRGNVAAAHAEISKLRHPPNVSTHLLFYMSPATSGGSTDDIRKQHLDAAIADLSQGDADERAYADALAGKSNVPLGDLLRRSPVDAKEKAVIVAVLGLRDPTAREQCFNLARKLNYDKRFPHLAIKAVVGD